MTRGFKRPQRRDSEDGDLERRHPFENVQRFSSPSRPRRDARVDDFRRLGMATAVSSMIQGLLWVGMSTAAILVYQDIIPVPDIPSISDTDGWNDTRTMLTYLYFKEGAMLPGLPQEGLISPLTMYRMMASVFFINAFWFITSSILFAKLRSGGPRSWALSVRVWSFSTAVVTVMDVVLGAAMIRDMVVLAQDEPLDVRAFTPDSVSHSTALVLTVALRAGLILAINVGLMISLLYLLANRLNPLKRLASVPPSGESPSATKREGPIDAFLFSNNHFGPSDGPDGIRNPAYVPEDAEQAAPAAGAPHAIWTSFKPAPEGADRQPGALHGPPHAAGGKKLRRITSKELEDVEHLTWMEEPHRHVDVEMRRPLGWPPTSPPADDVRRHDVLEAEQLPDGHTGLGPGFGFSYLHGPGYILPRARINAVSPALPSIPPPDYSPPARRQSRGQSARATVQRRARRAGSPPPLKVVPIPCAPMAPEQRPGARAPAAEGGAGGAPPGRSEEGVEVPEQTTAAIEVAQQVEEAPVSSTATPVEDQVGVDDSREFVVKFREYRWPGEEEA